MPFVAEPWESLIAFVELGGNTLWAIFGATLLMWTLILERTWYYRFIHPRAVQTRLTQWTQRAEHSSWYADRIRQQWLSELDVGLSRSLGAVKTLVAVCPLLGLLGTVLGMLEVFDVIALSGNNNVRAMASGVSQATVSTMAGMIAALSGMYFSFSLQRRAHAESVRLQRLLVFGGD